LRGVRGVFVLELPTHNTPLTPLKGGTWTRQSVN